MKKKRKIKNGEVKGIMTTIRTRLAQHDKKLIQQGRIQVAKRLLNMGYDKEQVQKASGLTKKQFDKLINE